MMKLIRIINFGMFEIFLLELILTKIKI